LAATQFQPHQRRAHGRARDALARRVNVGQRDRADRVDHLRRTVDDFGQ
jgi:hypothetical protein